MGKLAGKVAVVTGLQVVDSHTAGEPTRVVVDGGPDLGAGPLDAQRDRLREHHDDLRRAVILEPRGSDALVGALLCRTPNAGCAAGVVFFNNVGYLGMCGHGAIGVAVTLAHLGRVELGKLSLDTPVGTVAVELTAPNEATVENVESYCWRRDVAVDVDGLGTVRGDVAWGGNWFFLVEQAPAPLDLEHEAALTDAARRIKDALASQGVTGADGAEIDHIELFGPPRADHADSRNFVLCPGMPTTARPAGPARVPSSPALPPAGNWLPAKRGSRRASSAATSPPGTAVPPTAASSRASAAKRSSVPRRR